MPIHGNRSFYGNSDCLKVVWIVVEIVNAHNFMMESGSVVESASALAQQVVRVLEQGRTVRISLAGVKGLPSSYFNVLLEHIVQLTGFDAIGERVQFEFDSRPQQVVFARSLEAIRRIHSARAS